MTELPKPHLITAIDPGKRLCGCSTWLVLTEGAIMLDARAVHGDGTPAGMARALGSYSGHQRGNAQETVGGVLSHYFAIEVPQRYAGKHAKRGGVTALEAVIDEVERAFGGLVVARHTPNEWKAQVPKKAHHRRVRAALSPGELINVLTPGDHNTWDGVGYGCFIVGRLKRGGVR